MELKARVGKALAWSAVGEWGRQVLSFVVFAIIARALPPAAFGLVALASAFIVLGQVLVDQGMSDAIIQRKDLREEHLNAAFWLTLAMAVVLGGFGLAVARPLARSFGQPRLVPVLSWMLLAMPLSALASVQQAILRRALNFRVLAIRSLAGTIVGGAAGILLALNGFGVWALVVQTLTTSTVGVLTLWTLSNWRPGLALSRAHLQELISFGWNVGGSSVLGFVSRRADDIIIGFFLGPVALGYYTMGYRILELTQAAFVNITVAVSYPAFASVQSDPPRLASMFLVLTQFMSLVAFPAAVGISILAPDLVGTAFGSQWTPTAEVLRVLAFAIIIIALFIFNGVILKTMGKPNWMFRLAVLDAAANIVGFLIAVRWGIVAVAFAGVLCAYMLVPLRLWLLPRLIPLRVSRYFLGLLPATMATISMAAVVLGARSVVTGLHTAPTRLFVFSLIGAVTYVLVLLVIAPSLCRRGFDAVRTILAPNPGGRAHGSSVAR